MARKYYQHRNYHYSGRSIYQKWDWSGYKYSFQEDDDTDLVIKDPEGYVTPRQNTIRDRLGHFATKFSNFSECAELVKNLSRYFYLEMYDEKELFRHDLRDKTKLSEEDEAKVEQYEEIIKKLKTMNPYGLSPLGKAITVIRELYKREPKNGNDDPTSFCENNLQECDFNDGTIRDPDYNELRDLNEFTKKFPENVFDKLSLIQDFGTQFEVELEVNERVVHNSNIRAQKRMSSYEQINQIQMYQRMMPNYKQKLALKDLGVSLPVCVKETKQKIIILVDYSGSMGYEFKQSWVCAMLMNRLKHCIQEKCEIFFSFFVNRPSDLNFTHIYDKKTAFAFWKTFSTEPNGGDTYLGDMVNKINSEIEQGRLCNLDVDLRGEKVEILAIADGQDSVKTENFSYKTNAISIQQENNELKKLCKKNKGRYVFIDKDDQVTFS